MFYDKYKELCIRNGESPFGVAKKLGISSRTQGNWKAGSEPRIGTLVKIAEYFGVDVSYFDENNDMEEEDDVDAMREELKTNPDLRILLSASSKLNAEDLRQLVRMAKLMRDEQN